MERGDRVVLAKSSSNEHGTVENISPRSTWALVYVHRDTGWVGTYGSDELFPAEEQPPRDACHHMTRCADGACSHRMSAE